jgi:hypothetical protein
MTDSATLTLPVTWCTPVIASAEMTLKWVAVYVTETLVTTSRTAVGFLRRRSLCAVLGFTMDSAVLGPTPLGSCAVFDLEQNCALKDAIGSYAC